jgi:hypothetical protein
MRSSAENFDQFLLSSSRVRCSLARQVVNLSLADWLYAAAAAPRQLAVTSQIGMLSDTATRVLRAEASVGQNEMPSAETVAMAITNRRNMTISQIACNLSLHYEPIKFPRNMADVLVPLYPIVVGALICTAIGHVCLTPQKRTCAVQTQMSAKGQ